MGWSPNHARIKERYSPKPNAVEARHEQRLRDHPCLGCGRFGVELHHTLRTFPAKRWRRDHRYQLPLCAACHRGADGIHGLGSETLWETFHGLDNAEIAQSLWAESERIERG